MASTALGADLAPQRPTPVREHSELPNHVLEPAWEGTRVLVRIGHDGPRFTGYDGPVDGPRELFDAIQAETHCSTAILDGVLVANWEDDRDLEVDPQGNAFTREMPRRQIFAAFDLLEVDGEPLVGAPLLERKRHLEGLVTPSPNVRLTAYVTRSLRTWHETLGGLGFRRVVLKDWNSPYSPGQTARSWLVVDKLNPPKMK
ncbi:MAG: ATP-dependent DNA ligase [Candidatus Limnocylindria bacterium]